LNVIGKKSILSTVGSTNKFITTKMLSELPSTKIDFNEKKKDEKYHF